MRFRIGLLLVLAAVVASVVAAVLALGVFGDIGVVIMRFRGVERPVMEPERITLDLGDIPVGIEDRRYFENVTVLKIPRLEKEVELIVEFGINPATSIEWVEIYLVLKYPNGSVYMVVESGRMLGEEREGIKASQAWITLDPGIYIADVEVRIVARTGEGELSIWIHD